MTPHDLSSWLISIKLNIGIGRGAKTAGKLLLFVLKKACLKHSNNTVKSIHYYIQRPLGGELLAEQFILFGIRKLRSKSVKQLPWKSVEEKRLKARSSWLAVLYSGHETMCMYSGFGGECVFWWLAWLKIIRWALKARASFLLFVTPLPPPVAVCFVACLPL